MDWDGDVCSGGGVHPKAGCWPPPMKIRDVLRTCSSMGLLDSTADCSKAGERSLALYSEPGLSVGLSGLVGLSKPRGLIPRLATGLESDLSAVEGVTDVELVRDGCGMRA